MHNEIIKENQLVITIKVTDAGTFIYAGRE
jgi:hypothetical protein